MGTDRDSGDGKGNKCKRRAVQGEASADAKVLWWNKSRQP